MEEGELRLRSLFHACDVNRSGQIEYDEFFTVCRELQVQDSEIDSIFHKLDADRDGSINFQEFTEGFEEVSEMINFQALKAEHDWDEFLQRLGGEASFIPRPQQVAALYQNLQTEPILIHKYECVIKDFIRDIILQNAEMEKLAFAVKRAQDEASQQLSELEEEIDQRIKTAVQNTQKEEQRKAESEINELKRQYDAEVNELQKTVTKLKKENQTLKKELLEAQTTIMLLQSEVDTVKSDYADQSMNLERDHDIIRDYTDDRESLTRQIEMLQSANRKLHDSNDSLRAVLENSLSRNKSSRSSYVDEDLESLALCDPMRRISCEVESLTESCFDSGLSTLRDSNEYDSEGDFKHQRNFQRSQCVQEGFEGDASDTDVPEIPDEGSFGHDSADTVLEWKPSQPVSRSSSGASSSRRCISAFSSKSDSTDVNPKFPQSNKAFKIVLAGDAAVGKSSFLLRLCKNEFRGNTSATLGVDFQMKSLIVDGEQTVLQLWDTAGQERFRSIAKSYFRRADGVLLLYDVTCEKSFLNVREWVDMIEDSTHENIPIMLVGNKVDLRERAIEEGQKSIPTSYGEKLAMVRAKS
uniref:RAS and EF-hand domain containing n=1 Tax=Callorhinchus milii TaxID=7868 RepID=A0A4W3IRB8_CALMI